MSFITTPRLYRKRCGTYFLRVLLHSPSEASSFDPESRKRRTEVRQSLRTKDPGLARQVACWANAVLARCTSLTDRVDVWRELSVQIKRWEIPGVLKVNGAEDQYLLEKFLTNNPESRAALDHRIRNAGIAAEVGTPADLNVLRDVAIEPGRVRRGSPANPMRMRAAAERYAASLLNGAPVVARTLKEKQRALSTLCTQLPLLDPPLNEDPWVHEIEAYHLSAYLDGRLLRPSGRNRDLHLSVKGVSAATVLKHVSNLRLFFDYALDELNATRSNPAEGLEQRVKRLRTMASTQKQHYKPYTDEQLISIFRPDGYLAANNQADYFWAPLLGLHLGARLGEIVTLKLEAIRKEDISDVWFLEVVEEEAKNKNSARRLPITDRLIELGFLDYVSTSAA